MSWSRSIQFKRIRKNTRCVFTEPDVHKYEQAKQISLVRRNHKGSKAHFVDLDQKELLQAKSELPPFITRVWNELYSRRITCALNNQTDNFNLLSVFPGDTWNNFAPLKSLNCAAPLAFYSFVAIENYINPGLGIVNSGTGALNYRLVNKAVDVESGWLWTGIEAPQVKFVEAIYDKVPSDLDRATQLNELSEKCYKLISRDMRNIDKLFKLVRDAWSDVTSQNYSKLSLQLSSKIFRSCFRELKKENLLPFVFEVEAFASYITYLEKINPVASGVFSENWLDVGYLPLVSIKPTELCVTERLYSELFNIHEIGFAPIVVNEFDSVADGNHRLTSAWLWNVLKYCSNVPWNIESSLLKSKLKQYALLNESAMGDLMLYECYKQLGNLLSDKERAYNLENRLKPVIKKYKSITSMPVVFSPEYSTNAVIKSDYDSNSELRRVPPRLYEHLANSQDLVLPPRASYHFTDSVPMPWFKVLEEETPVSLVSNRQNLVAG